MMNTDTSVVQERIGQLCHQFKLPTVAAETTSRFTEAGHGDALPTLLEVLEQEAEDRRQRRIIRLLRESRLPLGKTWETPVFTGAGSSSTTGCPWRCASNWTIWPRAVSWSTASTSWPSDCPAPARPTPCAPWGIGWWKPATPSSSHQPTAWCRACPREDGGTPRRQARPGPAPPAPQAGQLRLPASGRPGLSAQGAEESEVLFTLIAERYERRSLGITSNRVGTHLRQPHGHRRGHRPGGAPLGHPGIRRAQLPHRSGPAAGSGTGGEPAKLIDDYPANIVDAGHM